MPQNKTIYNTQAGNVFIIILVAVVLFGALIFTFSRSGSQGISSISKQEAKVAAQEILNHARLVENAVDRLRRNGCSENEISFDHTVFSTHSESYLRGRMRNIRSPLDQSCHLYSLKGGKLLPSKFPESAGYSNHSTNRLHNYYTPAVVHIENIGTNPQDHAPSLRDIKSTDLILTAQFLNKEVCENLNKLTKFSSDVPDMTGLLYENIFSTQGSFESGFSHSTIIRTSSQPIFNGKNSGCFYQGTPAITHMEFPRYIFYHVLLAR